MLRWGQTFAARPRRFRADNCYKGHVTVPEARKDDRLRRYDPRSISVPVGDRSLRLVVPAARDFLRKGEWARSFRRDDEPPYWVEVWPASLGMVWALARWSRATDWLRGRAVLDLGCGLGVPGLAAASLGARVTFLDREADALAFATWNGARVVDPAGSVQELECGWDDPVRTAELNGKIDVVLLADVSYHASGAAGLLATVERALAPDGIVLHADPSRPESIAFLERLGRGRKRVTGLRRVHQRGKQGFDRQVDVRLTALGSGGAGWAGLAAVLESEAGGSVGGASDRERSDSAATR